jgi:multicomponent Na+:H+ antiporter subunit F
MNACFAVLGLALVLSFYRLLKGPSQVDRIGVFDLLMAIAIALLAGVAMLSRNEVFLDIAIVLAFVSFLSTVAFAAYVEQGEEP